MSQFPSVALVTIVVIVVLGPIYVVVRAIADPLRRVPGPFWARFTRLWYLREVYGGEFEKHSLQLHRELGKLQCNPSSVHTADNQNVGPIVRIAPNEYSIDAPAAVKTIYGLGTKFYKVRRIRCFLPSGKYRLTIALRVAVVYCFREFRSNTFGPLHRTRPNTTRTDATKSREPLLCNYFVTHGTFCG